MKRRNLLIALGAGLAVPLVPLAQQTKIRRIGFLAPQPRPTPSNPNPEYGSFVKGMRELGYVEGKNLVIEWRYADGKYERLPALAAELVGLKLEAIVTHGTPATQALQRATKTIPIVFAVVIDPVESGFAASLARPGANITGLSNLATDVSEKQVELLRTLIPKLSRIAVLINPGNPIHPEFLKNVQAAGQRLGLRVLTIQASTAEEIERGFVAMARERAGAVIIPGDAYFLGQRPLLPQLSLKHMVPSISQWREHVTAGALVSYGGNIMDLFRHAATYVDKILRGAKPGELPIEQPTKIHLAINLKTAKALGITVSKELVFRADEVVE